MFIATRSARFGVIAAGLLLSSLAPTALAAPAQADSHSSATPSSSATAPRAARTWHRKMVVGKGKRAVKVFTCQTSESGNYTAHFKVTTRKSSDRSAPRIEVHGVSGSQRSDAEFSLFPGDLTQTWSDGVWSADAVFKIKVHHQGKTAKKGLSVGSFGPC